ncbi:MAG: hypothetical protein IJH90_08255 [Mogibacterium sp.]|nr:hypothetical protein [Mogibacterium sp.]
METRKMLKGCVGCKACEMACSMHHTDGFGFRHSSIEIQWEKEGYSIAFKDPMTCDTCEGEGENNYQCVKYCYRAKDALKAFILNTEEGGEA